MKDKLQWKIFLIGLGTATIVFIVSKHIEAPLAILVISIAVGFYQYFYLPKKHKEDNKKVKQREIS